MPTFDHEASLEFDFPDESHAHIVERSVSQEVGEIDGDRSRARVDRDGATLQITIDATDLVGLRAGLNTWLGLVSVAEQSVDAAQARH